MGEESKVRVNKPKQPTESPSPLMGEESKARVTASQNNRQNPLSLDGRGIKGEGEQDKTTIFPLSLDGRGIKGEGESKTVPIPSSPQKRRVCFESIHSVIVWSNNRDSENTFCTRLNHLLSE